MRPKIILLIAILGVAGCEETAVQVPERWTDPAASHAAPIAPRWYGSEQLATGKALYRTHCAECHGQEAEGTPSWRQPGPDGKYPVPQPGVVTAREY